MAMVTLMDWLAAMGLRLECVQCMTALLARSKDCSIKFRSKHSSNTVLCLLRNLMEQTLLWDYTGVGNMYDVFSELSDRLCKVKSTLTHLI